MEIKGKRKRENFFQKNHTKLSFWANRKKNIPVEKNKILSTKISCHFLVKMAKSFDGFNQKH